MLEAKNENAYPQAFPPNWEGRFRELLENVHLIAMMLEGEGRITFCNTYLLQLTGWDEANVRGANWFDLFIPAEERGPMFDLFSAGIRDEEFPAHHQNAIKTRSGQRRTIRWNNTVLREPGGRITGCASIGEDITDTLLLEQQYRQAQKLESVGRLAGGVAHDFNNLLTVINGYADLLLADVGQRDPLAASVQEIRKAGERATSLTRQLLTFSRSQPADVRPVDLNQIVADQASLLRRLVGEDVELSISCAPGLGAVMADPTQIQQVLMNLAVNSRDAMPSGGRLTIEISAADSLEAGGAIFPEAGPGPYAILTVSDTGSGMSDDVRAQAFDPFFTTKPVGQGTGLGLSTVYGIVRQLRGWISLHSEPGSGTSFRIGFPRTEQTVCAEPAVSPSAVPGGSETVLLVEDHEEVRLFAAGVLRMYGYRVLDAASAGDAVLIAEQHPGPIHLMLTDVVMPRMNGYDLVRRLSPFRPEMHVLYMSGYPGDAIAERGVCEMGPCISKPFTPERLAQRVRAVLGGPAALPRILVADDDEAVRRLFCKVLEAQGYAATAVADGRQAISLMTDQPEDFRLIIIDLVMPEREGIETICSLRKDRPDLKILAVSGAFKDPMLDNMLRCASMLGADATLPKPVRPEDLAATVRTLLA